MSARSIFTLGLITGEFEQGLMHTVLLIIHLIVAAGLIGVVLMQKSEGGALGIGGGPGGMMSGRGAADLLSRLTMILGAVFIGNSILLAIVTGVEGRNASIVDRVEGGRPSNEITIDDLGGGLTVPTDDIETSNEPSVPMGDVAPEPAAVPTDVEEAPAQEPSADASEDASEAAQGDEPQN